MTSKRDSRLIVLSMPLKVWLYVDFVRAGNLAIQSWQPGVSCGCSVSMEHSASFPANNFNIPNISLWTQDPLV